MSDDASGIYAHQDFEVPTRLTGDPATYAMNPREHRIICALGANVDITLPPVAQAKGQFYSFLLETAGGFDIDLLVGDGALNKTAIEALDMDADNDAALLFSDGERWWIVANNIA